MKRTRKQALDLTSPPREGEVTYTPVQVSRLVQFIVRRLRTIAIIGSLAVLTMLVLIGGVVLIGNATAQDRCHDQKVNRDAIRELIAVAINDLDHDGKPDTDSAPNYLAILKSPQFDALDRNDQDFMRVLLTRAAQSGPTTPERLVAYADSLAAIEC